MSLHRYSYKIRLKPNKTQRQMFWQFAGNRRFVYNNLLAWSSTMDKEHGLNVVNRGAMGKHITAIKQEFEFLKLSHVHTLQNAGADLIVADKAFFAQRGKYPRCQSKRDAVHSFRYKSGVKVEGAQVWLPKIGWVKFRKSQEIAGTIKSATVKRPVSGWSVSLSCEGPVEKMGKASRDVIGIDFGFNRLATMSNGDFVESPSYYRKAAKKLARLPKKLSRAKRGAANRAQLRLKVAKHQEPGTCRQQAT